jgi:hypothetical protein
LFIPKEEFEIPSFVDFADLKERVSIEEILPMLGIAGAGNSAQWRGPCPACESGVETGP